MPSVCLAALLAAGLSTACATTGAANRRAAGPKREDVVARAQVWRPTDVARLDLRRGPQGAGAFAPEALVECTYDARKMHGATPKFTCVTPAGDELKVKYGARNGEVYAEVAATRLLWALGFGADRMYPVRVRCHECPETPDGPPRADHVETYDIAAIERKFPGREFDGPGGAAWAFSELDRVDPGRGGASLAERDALRLLAAVLQHGDSKTDQQRLVCLDGTSACTKPFMLVHDLGRTFGRANPFSHDEPGSVNLAEWKKTRVWADATGCRANLDPSIVGTLEDPVVTDAGRRLLLERLQRLTDRQLRDLFTVARFPMRARAEGREESVPSWIAAFHDKVAQIAERSCLRQSAAR